MQAQYKGAFPFCQYGFRNSISVQRKSSRALAANALAANARRAKKAPRRLKFSYLEQKEYATIEEEIAGLEEKIGKLEEEMNEAASDYARLSALTREKEETSALLEEKMERWMVLEEKAARIEAGEMEEEKDA